MEYKILSESLVYYAAKDKENGKYKNRDLSTSLNNGTCLYNTKEDAEKYSPDGYEAVKIKLIQIQ